LRWQLASLTQLDQDLLDGLSFVDGDELAGHVAADPVLRVRTGILERGAIGRVERACDLGDDLLWQRLGDVAEILGIQRRQHRDEIFLRQRVDQRGARRFRHLDEHEASLAAIHLLPHGEAIVARQGVEDVGDVRAVHPAKAHVQLDEILPMLQLFEEVLPAPVLALSHRRQHAVLFEQTGDLGDAFLQSDLRAQRSHDAW
jgi:hypothetical protein